VLLNSRIKLSQNSVYILENPQCWLFVKVYCSAVTIVVSRDIYQYLRKISRNVTAVVLEGKSRLWTESRKLETL
jgi:hypothetical protein